MRKQSAPLALHCFTVIAWYSSALQQSAWRRRNGHANQPVVAAYATRFADATMLRRANWEGGPAVRRVLVCMVLFQLVELYGAPASRRAW